jgi:phosphotransferase system enzyme I (PtsP)
MVQQSESESRKLLSGLQAVMAEPVEGQERLNRITHLIADSMGTEVCSIYLLRDPDTLELCATRALRPRPCT